MTLELIPNNDLVFKGPFNAVSITALKLSNSGDERLAYKIKTTAPKRYCVKPNSGFLDPCATAGIQVMLQPQVTGQLDDRTKHKFMVQWATVSNNYTEDVENFWKQDSSKYNVQDAKLRCVFADEQPAAVVPNDSYAQRDLDGSSSRPTESINAHENRTLPNISKVESVPASSSFQRSTNNTPRDNNTIYNSLPDRQQDAGDDSNKSRAKSDLDRLREENTSLKEKVKQQELRQRNPGVDRVDNPVIDRLTSNGQKGQKGLVLFGITLNQQLILMAFVIALLFGFSFGYFLFSCGN